MKVALPIAFLAVSQFAISQNLEVQKWQENNPHVLFIEATDYAELSEQKKALLGSEFIVFNDKISQQDIANYLTSKSDIESTTKSIIDSNSPNADEVKAWLAKNSDLKIISNDYFSSLNQVEQQVYLEADALIYQGEHLTIEDIRQYNESH